MNIAEKNPLFTKQLELEARYKGIAAAKIKQGIEQSLADGQAEGTPVAQRLIERYLKQPIAAIKEWIAYCGEGRGAKPSYYPYVVQMRDLYSPETLENLAVTLSYISLAHLFNSFAGRNIFSNITQAVAKEIEREMELQSFLVYGVEEQDRKRMTNIIQNGIDKRVQAHYKRYFALNTMQSYSEDGCWQWSKWNKKESLMLAAYLLNLVIEETPFFELKAECIAGQTRGQEQLSVYPTDWLLKTWAKNNENLLLSAFKFCPTIIPPKKWTSFTEGGYWGELQQHCKLLRINGSERATKIGRNYIKTLDQLELKEVKAAVNAIQETPWRVNKRVLEVLQKIVKAGGDRAGIPRFEPLPELPELVNPTEEQLKEHKRKICDRRKLEKRRQSLALRTMALLEMAKEFVEYEQIYFPHNMDFRGRVYPLTGAFSPQSDDIGKGLLQFASPPACSSLKDIEWLAVHGANLAGVDKVSFKDRVQWVKDNTTNILQSAKDPLGYDFWMQQDEPVQFLSFCFEWESWKKWEKEHNGNPEGFMSYIPIAFDGSCSGLQHFSAILRDEIGGQAVNLIPSDIPQDIYGKVAAKVNEILEQDSKTGSVDGYKDVQDGEENTKSVLVLGTKTLAQQWLSYGVTRKVCKRSTMTLCYGSREYGFREQLLEDIIEPAIAEGRGEMFLISPNQMAAYMAKCIWKSVQQVVVKAVEGMAWLQQMAKLVTKGSHVVTWVTPLGLPVMQGYMLDKAVAYRIRLRSTKVRLYDRQTTGEIDKKSQASGIAPNFIHSMDASHLQLTVLNAHDKAGIKHFAMIHDSYGTAASQADRMFRIVRQSFVQMYSEHDVLQDFLHNMEDYIDPKDVKKIPDLPEKGNLKLEAVLDSLYCFA